MNQNHEKNGALFMRTANKATSWYLKFILIISLIFVAMLMLSACSKEDVAPNDLRSLLSYSNGKLTQVGPEETNVWSRVRFGVNPKYWDKASDKEKEIFVIDKAESLKRILVEEQKLKEDEMLSIRFYIVNNYDYEFGIELAQVIMFGTSVDPKDVSIFE